MKKSLLLAIMLAGCASQKGTETSQIAQHNNAAKAHVKSAQGYNKQVDAELSDLEKDLEVNLWVF